MVRRVWWAVVVTEDFRATLRLWRFHLRFVKRMQERCSTLEYCILMYIVIYIIIYILYIFIIWYDMIWYTVYFDMLCIIFTHIVIYNYSYIYNYSSSTFYFYNYLMSCIKYTCIMNIALVRLIRYTLSTKSCQLSCIATVDWPERMDQVDSL